MTSRIITVTGRWPFPTDMLRHDRARPATQKDHDLIERLSGAASDPAFRKVRIDLVVEDRPTDARWRSFGWTIVGDPEIEQERAIARETEAQEALRRSALRKLTPAERQALGV